MIFTPLTSFDYHEVLEGTPGLALVVLTSPGCGACRRVKAALTQGAPTWPLRLFEVDVSRSPGVAQALEVFHLPALFLYKDGDFHAPVHAEARADKILAAIARAADAPAEDEP